MPSPFPGMDPYLESPDWFPDLHDGLIFCLKESLQNLLPESYYAQSSQRIWMEYSGVTWSRTWKSSVHERSPRSEAAEAWQWQRTRPPNPWS